MKFKFLFFFLIITSFIFNYGCSYISSTVNYNDPLTAEEHNNLGVAYEMENKYKLAIREYKAALKKDPTLVTPLVNIGNIYFKQEKYNKAKKHYIKAIKKDDRNVAAANNLGNLFLKTGKDCKTGINYLSQTLFLSEIKPAYALDTLAMLNVKCGNIEKAIELLIQACNNSNETESVRSEINSHLLELGEGRCSEANDS